MKLPCAALVLLAWPLCAGAAQVTLSASTQSAAIAERIELRVVVRAEAAVEGIRVDVPAGAYDVIARSALPARQTADGRIFAEIITIAFFRTGDFAVGPFRVELLRGERVAASEQTGTLSMRIRSSLSESDKDIKPLKQLLPIHGDPRHLLPYAAGLLLLLLLAAGALLLRRKMTERRRVDAAPPLPPEIELEMRLRELRRKNLPQAGEFRHFFIALCDTIKQFLQRAYGFNAVDCTTAETVAHLQGRENDGEIVTHLEEIFRQADLVKFALLVPEKEAVARIWPMTDSLVRKHKQRREAAMAEAHVQACR